ncbi:MAG: hypothetical protein ABIT37_05850 [Luteolibacter sp.]
MITDISGEFYPGEIDPTLVAIAQSLVDAGASDPLAGWTPEQWAVLAEFGEKQVVIIMPDETDAGIDAAVKTAVARTSGLCLLIIPGSGKNPDTESTGPLVTLEIEMQLFVATRVRGKNAVSVMSLVGAVAKFYHLSKIRVSTFAPYEKLKFLGFDPLKDEDFTAFAINFQREMML